MSTQRLSLETLRSEAARHGLHLDEDTFARFEAYLALMIEWRDRSGLTALADPSIIQQRHFAESLALLVALRGAGVIEEGAATRVADIGTGAGLPGIPMLLAHPQLQATLVESSARRCRFLEAVLDALGTTDAHVVHARAEEAGRDPALRGQYDLVVARALAALPVLVEYGLPLLREGGVLATPKGSRAREELVNAAPAIAALGGVAEPAIPLPLPEGVPPQQVLVVRRVGQLDDRFPRRPGVPAKRPLR